MNFLKTLDQALDFDKIEKAVTENVQRAALSVVEEFPERNKAIPTPASVAITPSVLAEARELHEIWQAFDLERRKDEWEGSCAELKALRGREEPPATALQGWQRRAQDAEHRLYQLCSTLLSLPDPTASLYSIASLSARVLELEDANRKLTAAADAASRDEREVAELVDKHHKLLESCKEMQEELAKRDARINEMAAAAAEATAARQELNAQAAEMARLQRSLRSVRDEYDSTQQSLFELQSRMESLVGSRQQEAELAAEELERASKRAAELELERRQLLGRLEGAQQAAAAAALAAAGGEEGALPAGPSPGGSGALPSLSLPLGGGAAAGGVGLPEGLLERQLAVREEQLAAAHAAADAAARQAADAAARHRLEVATLQDQVSTLQLQLDRAEREVARRPEAKDYQELRRRLEALSGLVDVQMAAEGWSGEAVEATLRDPSAQVVTHVLQERARKLSSEASTLKRQLGERDKQIQELEDRAKGLESELQRRQQLLVKLEEDLAAAAAAAAGVAAPPGRAAAALAPSKSASHGLLSPLAADPGAAAPPAEGEALGAILGGAVAETAGSGALEGGAAAEQQNGGSGGGGGGGGGADGGGGLLEIVVSQRDRFRQRMLQLEEEKGQLGEELRKTQQQLQAARDDNVTLFEKVRYLERYSQKAAASAGRTTVVRVDAAGVAQPADGAGAGARGNRYQCGPFSLEVGGGRAGGGGAAGGAGGGGPLPANVVTTGAGGMRSRGGRKGAANQVMACFGVGDDVEAGGPGAGATAESRAARAYEARINPFAEFQQTEQEMRVRNMQVADRAVLAGGRLLMGSRLARTFLLVYTVLLHFVILLLFYYATTPCPAPLAVLDGAAAEAAVAAAGGAVAAGGAAAGRMLQWARLRGGWTGPAGRG